MIIVVLVIKWSDSMIIFMIIFLFIFHDYIFIHFVKMIITDVNLANSHKFFM